LYLAVLHPIGACYPKIAERGVLQRVSNFKYRAFISYSHRDTPFARWLHSALERYRVDGDLAGRKNSTGTLPKSLRPIFRDREEFSAGHSLTEQTLAALDASQFLIVLCSPNAAISKYVNEEVRHFKANGGASRVIPIIVDGEPSDAQRECFPPALRFKLGPDGVLTDQAKEPLAADARPQGDGKEIAKQKVIAGLLGLGLDEVMRRAERARKRRTRFVASLAASFLLLAVAAAGSAVYAYQKLAESNERLDEAIEIAYGIVTTATAMSDRYGIPQDLTLDLLGQAENALNGLIARGANTEMLQHRKALMLISFSDSYRLLGRYDEAISRATEGRDILAGLVDRTPRDVEWQDEFAVAEYKIGDVQFYWGRLNEAMEQFHLSLQSFQKRPDRSLRGPLSFAGAASTPYYWYWANAKLALMEISVGDTKDALSNVWTAQSLAERVAYENPSDVLGKRNLGLSHMVVCLIMQGHGDYVTAVDHCRAAVSKLQAIVAEDGSNSRWQRDLAWTQLELAGALAKLGAVDETVSLLRSAVSVDERLVSTDPKNILWKWHLWAAYFRLAQSQMRLGKLDEGLVQCRAAYALAEPEALRDQRNFLFRRQLAWSHLCVGDAKKALSDSAGALTSYRGGVEELQRLAELDTISAARKFDLVWAYNKTGDALLAQGHREEAVALFHKAAALAEQITNADRDNVDWEDALIWTQWRISQQEKETPARLKDLVARLNKRKSENRLSADLAWLLPVAETQLARLSNG
jgi:tetratricopeptide (TPR) repeat protein